MLFLSSSKVNLDLHPSVYKHPEMIQCTYRSKFPFTKKKEVSKLLDLALVYTWNTSTSSNAANGVIFNMELGNSISYICCLANSQTTIASANATLLYIHRMTRLLKIDRRQI